MDIRLLALGNRVKWVGERLQGLSTKPTDEVELDAG
jgi:hypothetical protein